MPEPVVYIRGGHLLRDQFSDEMLSDLKTITTIESSFFHELASTLGEVEGFLDSAALGAVVRQILPKDAPIASVRRVILNVKAEEVPNLIGRLRRLEERSAGEFALTKAELGRLDDLLPKLLKPVPALRRFRKAERLTRATGQPVEDLQLVCDLRPVFDESRDNIEGLIPLTRLKVVLTGGDGLPNVFEGELSAKQVRDLAEQATKAVDKLRVLRKKSEGWAEYGVPNVPAVESAKKGASDE